MNIYEKARNVISKPYAQIQVGEQATLSKTITNEDVFEFARITGDVNPIHLDDEFAKKTFFKERIAHGMLTSGYISAILGTKLPGTNSVYLSQDLTFKAPVKIGDTITVIAEVIQKRDDKRLITLQTNVFNQENKKVVEGKATIMKRE
ncbi:MaoC family dehydratase [Anaerobacillus sp. MEB173]|uniref:MaoC family dehydratase n=1 Tax=Anaerobacillus sp. MEB173 TaxID=3383345 RepID=UPI003F92737A